MFVLFSGWSDLPISSLHEDCRISYGQVRQVSLMELQHDSIKLHPNS